MSCTAFILWFVLCHVEYFTTADYQCLCNYQVETSMFGTQDTRYPPVGYLYEFDCKPITPVAGLGNDWIAVMNVHQIAYVQKSDSVAVQVCQGSVPSGDRLSTTTRIASTGAPTPTVTTSATSPTSLVSTTRSFSTGAQTQNVTTTTLTTSTTAQLSTTVPTFTTSTSPTTTVTTTSAKMTKDTNLTTKLTTLIKATYFDFSTSKPTQSLSTSSSPSGITKKPTPPNIQNQQFTTTHQGDSSLCPLSVTQTTDARWVRQYKNFCYEIVNDRYEDWYDALDDCQNRHRGASGTLLEIYSSDIQNFMVKFLQDESFYHPVWIGLQDVDQEEVWDHWETDTRLTFDNFDPNRKNNYAHHSKEDCVLLEPSGLWDDSICDETDANKVADDTGRQLIFTHSWVCQYPTINQKTTVPPPINPSIGKTTPFPLINVSGQLSLCPSHVIQTTDPDWLRQYNQFCYELVPLYKDWYQASQYCSSRGSGTNGRLIEIYTQDIQQFIENVLRHAGYNHPVWIGLQDVDKEEQWDHWDSDVPVTYENFDPNRKNNYAEHALENCVLLEPSGYWDDSVCNEAEANQADPDRNRGLTYHHSWICQYPIQQQPLPIVG